MRFIYFYGLLFTLILNIESKTPPPLALLSILPDDFLKFFFNLGAAQRTMIDSFLGNVERFSNDEKTKLFIDKIKDPELGKRLHKVIENLAKKTKKLTKPAEELFDLFLVKPNVPRNTNFEFKKLTQLRISKYLNLKLEDKTSLAKQFPEISSFFDTLVADKQIREFADA